MLAGVQDALTDVMVGDAGGVFPPPPLPPQPTTHNDPRKDMANKDLQVIRASSDLTLSLFRELLLPMFVKGKVSYS
jgi:hypothetical protein